MKKRSSKYAYHIQTSISAAKLSIEMFNRVDAMHSDQASVIFNAQAWEMLSKALLLKNGHDINESDGKSITAEKAVNKLEHILKIISREENQTIQQIVSLRNEALHNVYPKLEQEIITHLIYYSLKTFHRIVLNNFKNHAPLIDKNYLSVAFKETTFYSHKLNKLFKSSKNYSSENNKALYILDRACAFAENENKNSYSSYEEWKKGIKSKPKKSRIAMHLSVYDYIGNQDNVRIVPVEVKKGYKAEVIVEKTKRQNDAISVLVKKSDPDKDYPYLVSELATKIGKSLYFIQQLVIKLKLRGNKDFHTSIKTGKKSVTQKYSDKTLSFLKEYIDKNPHWSPYKKSKN